jgi:hypothetical protein
MKQKQVTNLNLLYLKDATHLQMTPTPEEMEDVAVTIRGVKDDIDARCVSGPMGGGAEHFMRLVFI